MPDDSNGIYNVPNGTLVNSGDTVLPSQHNPWANDSATAISNRFSKDGRAPATGNWNLNTFRITNLGAPTASADATTKGYVDATVGSPVQYVAQTLTAAQQAQARSNISAPLRGHIYGLNVTKNSLDLSNDFDLSAGEISSVEPNPVLMVLPSLITKRTDASWAVGSNQGALDTGSISNSTYYGYVIQRSDTGVVDALISLSSSSPTMPANYDRKSAAIFKFTRVGGVNGYILPLDRPFPTVFLPVQNATGTGTIDFSIPSGATEITINFMGVSTNSTNSVIIRLGTGGVPETTGYAGSVSEVANAILFSSGTGFFDNTNSASNVREGKIILSLADPSTNTWTVSFSLGLSDTANVRLGGGTKSISGTLDIVRLTMTSGQFDAGKIGVVCR